MIFPMKERGETLVLGCVHNFTLKEGKVLIISLRERGVKLSSPLHGK